MLLIGHRGMHGLGNSNTLQGFQDAIDNKMDMIEMDLRLWNSQIIVSHDTPLNDNPLLFTTVLDLLGGQIKLYLDIKESTVMLELIPLLNVMFVSGKWSPDQIYIASYNHYNLLLVKDMLPTVQRGALMACTPVRTSAVALDAGCTFVALDINTLTYAMLQDCKASGLLVFVYTIQNTEQLKQLEAFIHLLDGMVLDYPINLLPKC